MADHRDHNLGIAHEILPAMIALLEQEYGIVYETPAITSYHPGWHGEIFQGHGIFLPQGNGLIRVNTELHLSRGAITRLLLHELGHTAIYQYNKATYDELTRAHPAPSAILDEGVAMHTQIDGGKRLGLWQSIQSMRTTHDMRVYLFNDKYREGYNHVRKLREHGTSLTEIIKNPEKFLPA